MAGSENPDSRMLLIRIKHSTLPKSIMAPSATTDWPSPSEIGDNALQPCFVLHKALPRKYEKRSKEFNSDEDESSYEKLRSEAFNLVWSRIETAIKDVLKHSTSHLFKELHNWVHESFLAIKSSATCSLSEVTRPYPLLVDNLCRQLFTAFVLTKNIEIVDDLLTFKELGVHLKSQGCHIVNLSSHEFSVKHGIAGCFRSLLRQLVTFASNTPDISILASWYSEEANYDKPIVVIIEDVEQCSSMVLAEFITLLSEWVVKIPVLMIMGVATTVDAPRKLLPSNALQHLQPRKFTLGSPVERLDAIIEAAFVKPFYGFNVGYKVALFLRNYFLRHDGTITSFVRALKIACMKHFSMEQLSFLCKGIIDEDSKVWEKTCQSLPEGLLKYAANISSIKRNNIDGNVGDALADGISELMRLRNNWSAVVMCLFEVGKYGKIQLLDIFCEALDPSLPNCKALKRCLEEGKDHRQPLRRDAILRDSESLNSREGTFIAQAVRKVRDLPSASLHQLLKFWARHTEEIAEVNHKVQALLSTFEVEVDGQVVKQEENGMKRNPVSQRLPNMEKDKSQVAHEKAAMLAISMIRDYMVPIESSPFHEIFCFKHVDVLQSALIGDPRKTIQTDLLRSHSYLQCSCCSASLTPSMHDTSILYNLAQEHGDLINVHDWYESYKAILVGSSTKSKAKQKQSPTPKKRKVTDEPNRIEEASIQARFCRAVTELQITGLLRMPSKRRPDYVQRVAFGL
ncbi:origin of replication complex subunit 3 isoform X1 [Amborella trichopoda]|uniref:origin of replication complex subunit 3 isoform X1 n=2 Tax=Amborella trichopoda TaxID=13333 RepID=UPI0009C0DB8B|nr:origin of replication complex subunit 3 isoform X1 [Amborella trichopoda]|eukprot:XP_020529006.1 origin of replication complex subunit 3 isoform X1 [Amborella trichopoda]